MGNLNLNKILSNTPVHESDTQVNDRLAETRQNDESCHGGWSMLL